MTDKEKIKAEIEKLKVWQPIATPALDKLLSFIDSMPEEPKFRTGQTIRNKELGAEDTIIGIEEDHYNFRNGVALLISHQGDWELVDKDLDKAAEEYVERFYREHNIKPEKFPADKEISIADFKAGANWQKQKDTQKFLHSETATFTREEFTAEMEEVRRQCREQLMKDAVEGKVISYEGISFPVSNEIHRLGLVEGDKIKVIILKQEEK